MKNNNIAFGLVIRELRKSRKLTQEALADLSLLDRTFISLIELGRNSPSLDTIFLLCEALCISFSELAILVDKNLAELKDS